MSQSRYEGNLEKIVKGLRDMADRIEWAAKTDNPAHAVRKAAQVVHTLTWGTANLNVDSLLAAAIDWQELATRDADVDTAGSFFLLDKVVASIGPLRIEGVIVDRYIGDASTPPVVKVRADDNGNTMWVELHNLSHR